MLDITSTLNSHTPVPSQGDDQWIAPDDLRTLFAAALASMYCDEVPLYGDLVRIVRDTNAEALRKIGQTTEVDANHRISLERHGAIRLGTPDELQTVRRIFNLLGMHAVDYYDLSVAGLPMHACAFRPITSSALAKNPFRVFTTLLRPDLLNDEAAGALSMELLQRRNIFSDDLLGLLDAADNQGGQLAVDQIDSFVSQALLTFRWRSTAAATDLEYEKLMLEHPILADIACFQSAHINHLTPRTLDIDLAYESMRAAGLAVKSSIEGPPRRQNPIFLRQTSFLALQEPVQFKTADRNSSGEMVHGHHKARFGEIEERGAALTPKGRKLYDDLLRKATQEAGAISNALESKLAYERVFRDFPDDHEEMRAANLIFCVYQVVEDGPRRLGTGSQPTALDRSLIDQLVEQGTLRARTMTYEDFLPFSAAGIFQSNLRAADASPTVEGRPDRSGFEKALGAPMRDSNVLYQEAETESLVQCAKILGVRFDPDDHYR